MKNSYVNEAIIIATNWQDTANTLLTTKETTYQKKIAALLKNPKDKLTLIQMMDESFRSADVHRISKQLLSIIEKNGVPDFLSQFEKNLFYWFQKVGKYFPQISIPLAMKKIREESKQSVVEGETEPFLKRINKRKKENVPLNINRLGEAVLGEDEAAHRMEQYIHDLQSPHINYISVKLSTIYSQINPISYEHTIEVASERLRKLYRVARDNHYTNEHGERQSKFVNLDMEEYKDLRATVEIFMLVLEEEEFMNFSAGIVLQAYIPDSFLYLKKLATWSKARIAKGGTSIKIRLVKGANMEMELIESSHYHWPLAPYDSKLDVDSNYKKMMLYVLSDKEIAASVRLGIASHNLFELAFGFVVARSNDVLQYIQFEMLEGMAEHYRKAISKSAGVLLYTPVASKENFLNAIAYLVRRLDENTGEQNFLRYSPHLTTDSKEWKYLEKQFLNSCEKISEVSNEPNRKQNRFEEKEKSLHHFQNEPDTDFVLEKNYQWAKYHRDEWKTIVNDDKLVVPICFNGASHYEGRDRFDLVDSASLNVKTGCKKIYGKAVLASLQDMEKAVDVAVKDVDAWRNKSHQERSEMLQQVANKFRKRRGRLIGAMMANTGKTFTEADVEISEAIDFLEFYSRSASKIYSMKSIKVQPKGVGLVISPWNFPVAIPCGGIAASLAAGNTVLFKPATEAILCGYELCECFWSAGISKNIVQFIPCSEQIVGTELIRKKEIDFVILTGSTDTGLFFLKENPTMFLCAETGGKNATIVTAMSDRDQAIKNVVHSAFGNVGQKCSATSLLVLEEEVYEDENFKKHLVDAAKSLSVGEAWNFKNKIGALIQAPENHLMRALTTLDEGEEWILKSQMLNDNPTLWTPGIKYGVKEDSYSHKTEFFGPVLSVMKAKNLNHAIQIVNATQYGLTSGLESLDATEQQNWQQNIEAGNLYINRSTTGAVVLRQPFGGMKKSSIGSGIKAGGHNYITQFMKITNADGTCISVDDAASDHSLVAMTNRWQTKIENNLFPKEIARQLDKCIIAIKNYWMAYEQEFSKEKDYVNLRGQHNFIRYIAMKSMLIRIVKTDTLFDAITRISAAKISKTNVIVSVELGLKNEVTNFLHSADASNLMKGAEIMYETTIDVIKKIGVVERIRYAGNHKIEKGINEAAAKHGYYLSTTEPLYEGQIELLQYFKEQSLSINYHRYGNLGAKASLF